jgi:hypothetical protein
METQIINNKTQSSINFRWGGTGDEAKIYFDSEEDLLNQIEVIKKAVEKVKGMKS